MRAVRRVEEVGQQVSDGVRHDLKYLPLLVMYNTRIIGSMSRVLIGDGAAASSRCDQGGPPGATGARKNRRRAGGVLREHRPCPVSSCAEKGLLCCLLSCLDTRAASATLPVVRNLKKFQAQPQYQAQTRIGWAMLAAWKGFLTPCRARRRVGAWLILSSNRGTSRPQGNPRRTVCLQQRAGLAHSCWRWPEAK